ncbi:MAG TPA: response regulator, partial [Planctomycetota bacterium]|nr:response regulator [Planctomycetota bacterium]
MTDVRVLVADEDPGTHRVVEKALNGRGYEVAAATDGEQALEAASRWRPDVVVVEPDLPKVDGLSLVRQLRTQPDAAMIPALFLAERERVEPRIVGFKIGADDYLPKPLDPTILESRLAAALKSSRRVEKEIRGSGPEGAEFSVVMTGFRGSLEQIGLSSLMTLMEIEHKTGTLVVLLEDEKD